MFNLTDQNITQLAMEYDPAPILGAFSSMPQGNFLTMPQPEGVTPGAGPSYESIIAEMPEQGPAQPRAPAAPLSDVALRTLAGMNPRDTNRAPSAGIPGRPAQLQLQAPGTATPKRPMSLSQILGGR